MAKQIVTETEPLAPPMTTEDKLAAALQALVDLQRGAQQVQTAQLKQTAPKSNAAIPKISCYNLRGDKDFPMPPLKCEVHAPWPEKPTYHNLDREEVELFNLLEPGAYTVTLNDGTTQHVSVVGVRNSETNTIEKMSLHGPRDGETGLYASLFTNEKKQQYPAMRVMLREMIGEPAESVMTMQKEAALIKSGQLAVSQGE